MSRDDENVAEILTQANTDLQNALAVVRSYLEQIRDRESFSRAERSWFRLIEGRVKDVPGVQRKIQQRKLKSVWDVDDLIGLRIVVATLSDASDVASILANDKSGPLELKRRDLNLPMGYRAIHFNGSLIRASHTYGCEIQVRTAVQDAWAVVSRQGLYQHDDLPPLLATTALNESAHLAASDQVFDAIMREVLKPRSVERVAEPKHDAMGKDPQNV